MKNVALLGGLLIVLLFGLTWFSSSGPSVITRRGLHWHPELAIYIQGQRQVIPANIGLGGLTHNPVHTHDEDAARGVIHLEFPGVVRTEDIVLGKFFEAWNRDMRSFGTNMKMMVNGEESTLYENYPMHDGDKIELRYD